ncbi:putative major intrinsic protein [Helianthus anomalus]
MVAELGQSLADFGKAIKLLGAYEGAALGTAFSELGAKSEMLSIKLQREVNYCLFYNPIIFLNSKMSFSSWRFGQFCDFHPRVCFFRIWIQKFMIFIIKKHGGIAIGMIIMFNVFVGGPISGASMNPARSLGPSIVKWRFKGIWAYIVGPIIGRVTGGFVYKLLMPTEKTFSEIVKRSG